MNCDCPDNKILSCSSPFVNENAIDSSIHNHKSLNNESNSQTIKNVLDKIIEKIVDEHVENLVNKLKRFGELYDFEIVTESVTDAEWRNITSKD